MTTGGLMRQLIIAVLSMLVLSCINLGNRVEYVEKPEDPKVTECRERGMKILETHAPSAFNAMKTYYALIETGKKKGFIAPGPSIADNFYSLANYEDEFEMLQRLTTVVHESIHFMTTTLAWFPSREGGGSVCRGECWGYYFGNDERYLIPLSLSFPARKMDPSVPSGIRKSARYETYVLSPGTNSQTTQSYGINGLLEEFYAYSWSARTDLELLSYYEAHKNLKMEMVSNALSTADDRYHSYLEFRYFILHYVIASKKIDPAVYNSIMSNRDSRMMFGRIDREFNGMVDRLYSETIAILRSLSKRGYDVKEEAGPKFRIAVSGTNNWWILEPRGELWQHKPLEEELAEKEYRDMADLLANPD
jgi:hypothetical protein